MKYLGSVLVAMALSLLVPTMTWAQWGACPGGSCRPGLFANRGFYSPVAQMPTVVYQPMPVTTVVTSEPPLPAQGMGMAGQCQCWSTGVCNCVNCTCGSPVYPYRYYHVPTRRYWIRSRW